MAMRSELRVGDVVSVGPRYVMADHPPYAGRGRYEADAWTGMTLRVVGFVGPDDVMLAPSGLVDASESDEVVTIHSRRLTKQ